MDFDTVRKTAAATEVMATLFFSLWCALSFSMLVIEDSAGSSARRLFAYGGGSSNPPP